MNTPAAEINTSSASGNGYSGFPEPGSLEEVKMFKQLQEKFPEQFEHVFPDKLAPRTVVVIPSLTMDQEILYKIKWITHYEERFSSTIQAVQRLATLPLYSRPGIFVIF